MISSSYLSCVFSVLSVSLWLVLFLTLGDLLMFRLPTSRSLSLATVRRSPFFAGRLRGSRRYATAGMANAAPNRAPRAFVAQTRKVRRCIALSEGNGGWDFSVAGRPWWGAG